MNFDGPDTGLRTAAFAWLSPFTDGGEMSISWRELQTGFVYDGEPVTLIGQKGINENTNGLIRHYFPKSTDLNKHSADLIAEVAQELNDRPRKTLGMRTPHDVFNRHLIAAPATVATTT